MEKETIQLIGIFVVMFIILFWMGKNMLKEAERLETEKKPKKKRPHLR